MTGKQAKIWWVRFLRSPILYALRSERGNTGTYGVSAHPYSVSTPRSVLSASIGFYLDLAIFDAHPDAHADLSRFTRAGRMTESPQVEAAFEKIRRLVEGGRR